MSDSMDLDLVTLSRRLARREVSAVEVVKICLDRISRLDPTLNAFREVDAEGALAAAEKSDRRIQRLGPLDGMPVAIKDNIDIKGLIARSGIGPRGKRAAERDADFIASLRKAGAVILGHTNMHEGALGATNDNPHYGRTHNPWRQGYTPGGSSGGSAAAVAARLCPIALGTDTMGSIRLPAAYCGLAGYKPGRGHISNAGIEPLARELDQVGPIARSVADLDLWLKAMAGPNPVPNTIDLRTLRIARLNNVDDVDIADDVRKAFDDVMTMLERSGAGVIIRTLQGCDFGKTRRAGLLGVEAEAAAHFQSDRERYPGAFSKGFATLLDYGASVSVDRLAKASMVIADINRHVDLLFETIDLLLMPTAPQVAFPFDQPAPSNQADLTALANFAGAPAVSLPIALDRGGLPIGLQVIGPRGADRTVLAAAAMLENIAGFRLPDLPRGEPA